MSDLPLAAPSAMVLRQLFRYALIGIASNGCGYLAYLAITSLGVAPKTAMTFLYLAVAAIGFFGNRKFTFSHEGGLTRSGLRYVVAHAAGYFLNLTILFVFVDELGLPHQLVQAAAVFVVAAFLFVAFRFHVFRERDDGSTGAKT
jgi:putative flippase GtrA